MSEPVYPPYNSTERELSVQLARARRELAELSTLHDDLVEELSKHLPESMEDDVAIESLIIEWAERAARGIPAPVPTKYFVILTYQVGTKVTSHFQIHDIGLKANRNRGYLLNLAIDTLRREMDMPSGGVVLFFSIEPLELA